MAHTWNHRLIRFFKNLLEQEIKSVDGSFHETCFNISYFKCKGHPLHQPFMYTEELSFHFALTEPGETNDGLKVQRLFPQLTRISDGILLETRKHVEESIIVSC